MGNLELILGDSGYKAKYTLKGCQSIPGHNPTQSLSNTHTEFILGMKNGLIFDYIPALDVVPVQFFQVRGK